MSARRFVLNVFGRAAVQMNQWIAPSKQNKAFSKFHHTAAQNDSYVSDLCLCLEESRSVWNDFTVEGMSQLLAPSKHSSTGVFDTQWFNRMISEWTLFNMLSIILNDNLRWNENRCSWIRKRPALRRDSSLFSNKLLWGGKEAPAL